MTSFNILEETLKNISFNSFIDNDILAEIFGMNIIELNFESIKNMHVDNFILVNKHLDSKIMRETILHEIAHKLRHIGHYKNVFEYKKMEAQANRFLLLLALPEFFLLDDLINGIDIYELSNKYNVNIDIVEKRLELMYYDELQNRKYNINRNFKWHRAFL